MRARKNKTWKGIQIECLRNSLLPVPPQIFGMPEADAVKSDACVEEIFSAVSPCFWKGSWLQPWKDNIFDNMWDRM